MVQWEAFLKKRSYSGCRKSCPSGSSLPPAPLPIPPSASASSEAGRHSPSLQPSSPPSEGSGLAGKSGGHLPHWLSWCLLSPLSLSGGRGGGLGGEGWSWLLGASVTRLLLPSRGGGAGVARPSHSQESTVLAHSAPPSVDAPASAERDL